MDGKDVERLIAAAEECQKSARDKNCAICIADNDQALCEMVDAGGIIAVKLHYETLLKSERAKVIAEVREIIKDNTIEILDAGHFTRSVVEADELIDMIDSMEPDKGEQ